MGFYNIILEGQQAEEYKARKAKEEEDKKKKDMDHFQNRYFGKHYMDGHKVGTSYNQYNPEYESDKNKRSGKDFDRKIDEIEAYNKARGKTDMIGARRSTFQGKHDTSSANSEDVDVVYKHMRRHPEKYNESNIFESVRFLNEDSRLDALRKEAQTACSNISKSLEDAKKKHEEAEKKLLDLKQNSEKFRKDFANRYR